MRVCPGLVPEPTFQREAHEAAERAGRPETCVLPEPKADEDASGQAGARGADPQRALLLLWRYALSLFVKKNISLCPQFKIMLYSVTVYLT